LLSKNIVIYAQFCIQPGDASALIMALQEKLHTGQY